MLTTFHSCIAPTIFYSNSSFLAGLKAPLLSITFVQVSLTYSWVITKDRDWQAFLLSLNFIRSWMSGRKYPWSRRIKPIGILLYQFTSLLSEILARLVVTNCFKDCNVLSYIKTLLIRCICKYRWVQISSMEPSQGYCGQALGLLVCLYNSVYEKATEW